MAEWFLLSEAWKETILLLDEIDLSSNKIMCLQPILEGSGVFVKKINRFVKAREWFQCCWYVQY